MIGYMEPAAVGANAKADGRDEQAAAAAAAQAAQTIYTPPKPKADGGSRPAELRRAPESVPVARRAEPTPPKRGEPVEPADETDQALVISPEVPRAIPRGRELQKPRPQPAALPSARSDREEEAVPMSPIRRRIAAAAGRGPAHRGAADHVQRSRHVGGHRRCATSTKQIFQERYGIKLGFMSFFVKATIDALKLVPQVNAEIRGNDIVYHNYFDIGIAVGGGKGLVVPVLRNADRMSFAEIELTIADFAHRARDNSLQLEELQGGTFTISNGGVYGSLLSTPIVNPPQSGILGLHAIQDRPVARDGQVVIRPMMYVALTYDHRIVDGQGAVTFLKRVKDVIEEPMRMLVEI